MAQVPANRRLIWMQYLLLGLLTAGLCALVACRARPIISVNTFRALLFLLIATYVAATVLIKKRQRRQYRSLTMEQRTVVDEDARVKLLRGAKAAKRMTIFYGVSSSVAIVSVWNQGLTARLITAAAASLWVGLNFWIFYSSKNQLVKLDDKLAKQALGEHS